MMSSAYAVSSAHSSKKSIGLVGLLLLSTLGGIALTPSASATVSGDYEITNTIFPMDNLSVSAWYSVDLDVHVKNSGSFYNT